MAEQMGRIRYSLTVHFQDNGLLSELWQCGTNKVLAKCAARATGVIWLPSQQTVERYLTDYFNNQGLRILDPVGALPESPFDRKPKGIDLAIEALRQEKNPAQSMRWQRMRASVLDRDGYTCQHCGASNTALHIDHVKPRYIWPDLTWEPSNITTLCKPCHLKKTAGDYRRWAPYSDQSTRNRYRRKADKTAKLTAAEVQQILVA